MTPEKLDMYFPFVVFAYGFVMTFILNSEFFVTLVEERFPADLAQQFKAHRTLGLVCLIVGGLWSLQNLYL